MTFFGGEMYIFGAKISDDLLLLLFLVIDQIFKIFSFFSKISYIFAVKCHISSFPRKKSTFFNLFILSRASDNNTSLNIGETNAWAGRRPPPQVLGDRPLQFP